MPPKRTPAVLIRKLPDSQFQLTDDTGNPIPVKAIYPAKRGPLMVRSRQSPRPRSVYDLIYETATRSLVPSHKRAVPVNRDYSDLDAELELVTIKSLDKEHRDFKGPGRRSAMTLETVQQILGLLETQSIEQVAKSLNVGTTIVSDISTGKAYWYAR